MPSFRILSVSALTLLAAAQLVDCQTNNTPTITWGPCSDFPPVPAPASALCAALSVPLDYTAQDWNKTLPLRLLKIQAKRTPVLGTIILNFGGPGVAGRTQLAAAGDDLQALTGGQHDLVTFDPRGTATTLPFSCYQDDRQRWANSILARETSNSSDAAFGRLWAMGKVIADACHETAGENGELIGTAFVARDTMQIVDALGEDGLLRYWGLSYGTVLGATIARMFPHRIDRMVLDGVVNFHEYFNAWDAPRFTDTDKALSGFFSTCAASGSSCALARNGVTGEELEDNFYNFMENDLKYNPIPNGQELVEYSAVKSKVLGELYLPIAWPSTAQFIDGLLAKNESSLRMYARGLGHYTRSSTADSQPGIRCSDKAASLRLTSREQAESTLRKHHDISKLAGDTFVPWLMRCAQWNMPAKEHPGQLRGTIKTKHPILIIGNSYDPVTPIVNAFNTSASFEGSVVLRQDSYGHTSPSVPSVCTARAIEEYFTNGTLPAAGTICQPKIGPFSTEPMQVRTAQVVDGDDDERLLRSLQKLEEVMRYTLKESLYY